MPSNRSIKKPGSSTYGYDAMTAFAESYLNTLHNINEMTQGNIMYNPMKSLNDPRTETTLRNAFMEGCYDEKDFMLKDKYALKEFKDERNFMFENSFDMLKETAATANNKINPLLSIALPMYKNILMNMVWDKGGIPHKTAPAQIFDRTIEIRKLIDIHGNEIDMFLDQGKMGPAFKESNPVVEVELPNGENYQTEIVFDKLGGSAMIDHIDRTAHICAVKIKNVYFDEDQVLPDSDGNIPETGGTVATSSTKGNYDVWYPVRMSFGPGFGTIKRQLQKAVKIKVAREDGGTVNEVVINDVIQANQVDDKFMIRAGADIIAVKMACRLDASMRTLSIPTVDWEDISDTVEIGTDPGIGVKVTPEQLYDMKKSYNIDQTAKLMSLMKTAMAERRDSTIYEDINLSYKNLPYNNKFAGTFDYAPREGYMDTHIEWRQKTFFEYFDRSITKMLQVLNDPNMTVCVFGDPDLVRLITPKTYTYQAPSNIGPVELDFSKTVVTSDKRVYTFIGSDKMRGNTEFIVTLCPRNTHRIIYVIYDYQFYISNEIRDNNNPALPQIVCFDRYKFDEMQALQGRIKIVNPDGFRPGQSDTVAFTHVY